MFIGREERKRVLPSVSLPSFSQQWQLGQAEARSHHLQPPRVYRQEHQIGSREGTQIWALQYGKQVSQAGFITSFKGIKTPNRLMRDVVGYKGPRARLTSLWLKIETCSTLGSALAATLREHPEDRAGLGRAGLGPEGCEISFPGSIYRGEDTAMAY